MKITDVKTFLVNPGTNKNWLFVRVETDEGISGWGESYTIWDRDRSIEAYINQMKRYLIDRSPFNIKHFVQVMYDDYAARRGTMDYFCAISSIEQALWDIVGKKLNTPVYNLLGGACRDKIRVYANYWYAGASTNTTANTNGNAKTITTTFTATNTNADMDTNTNTNMETNTNTNTRY